VGVEPQRPRDGEGTQVWKACWYGGLEAVEGLEVVPRAKLGGYPMDTKTSAARLSLAHLRKIVWTISFCNLYL
jgi:hypothetical protein